MGDLEMLSHLGGDLVVEVGLQEGTAVAVGDLGAAADPPEVSGAEGALVGEEAGDFALVDPGGPRECGEVLPAGEDGGL